MAIIKAINTSGKGLKRCIDYVTRKGKLEDSNLYGIGCSPRTAYSEMVLAKELHKKTEGLQHLHLVLSLSHEESRDITPARLIELTARVIEDSFLFRGYQTLIAVHQDKEHLHAHIVVNTVSDDTGKKIQFFKHQLQWLKLVLAGAVAEYGLEIPTKGQSHSVGGNGTVRQVIDKTVYDPTTKEFYYNNSSGKVKSWEADIAYKVKTIIKECRSKEEYIAKLEEAGITISRWKDTGDSEKDYITYCIDVEGKTKRVKNRRLEEVFHLDFSIEGIHNELERNTQLDRTDQQQGLLAEGSEAERTEDSRAGSIGAEDEGRAGAGEGTECRRTEAIREQAEQLAGRIRRARDRARRNRSRAKLYAMSIRAKRIRGSIPKEKPKKQRILVRVKHRGY